MESIDRLRTYARGYELYVNHKLLDIADAIEREVEDKLTSSEYNMRLEHDEWVHDRDNGWVTLPLAADGEPIHIGDVMESDDGETFRVCRLQLFASGWAIDGGKYTQLEIRHHHAPTVEDVLKDFIDAWAEWKDGAAMMNPIETFAAKLRLAEGMDE